MSKHIQAYFQTESQAESAKTSLLTYATENIEVSKLGEAIGRNSKNLLPLVAVTPTGNMNTSGAVGVVGTGGGNNIIPIVEGNNFDSKSNMASESAVHNDGSLLNASTVPTEGDGELQYVLAAKVRDEDYDEIVTHLRLNHAFVEKIE